MPLSRRHHLPRLTAESYRGHHFVHWTMTIGGRATGWLTDSWHQKFRNLLNHYVRKYDTRIPAYCLMPDHLHLLVAGITSTCDQRLFIRALRRETNFLLHPQKLQREAYDHVLRPSESRSDAVSDLARYLVENPVRAGLAPNPRQWTYSGACVPEMSELDPRNPDFQEIWWAFWNKQIKP